jgi:hypothetical protein
MANSPTSGELALEALDPRTPPERLWEIVRARPDLGRSLSQNPGAPAELLALLSRGQDPSVEEALLGNPSTPLEILFRLGHLYPARLLENPLFPLLLLERPNLAEEVPARTLQALVELERAPEIFLLAGARHSDSEIRLVVAKNPATPTPVLSELARDTSDKVRIAVAAHPHAAPEVLERLVSDPAARDDLRAQVAKNPSTPPLVLRRLVEDRSPEVRRAASGNPATPGEVLVDLWRLGASRDLSHYRTPDSSLSPEDLASMASRGSWSRQLIARHSASPAWLLMQLCKDEEARVRQALAQNPVASPVLLEILAGDLDRDTRWFTAKHPATPEHIIARLAQEDRIRWELAEFPRTPPSLLAQWVDDPDPFVRRRLAWNPALSLLLLARLARDLDPSVQESARRAEAQRGLA